MVQMVKNLLELVPEQKRTSEERPDGMIDVILPRYGNGWLSRILESVFRGAPVRVQLDDVGTRVWRLCDGHRCVRDIGTSLHAELGDSIEPVYDRLGEFFKQMKKAGLIRWKNEHQVATHRMERRS